MSDTEHLSLSADLVPSSAHLITVHELPAVTTTEQSTTHIHTTSTSIVQVGSTGTVRKRKFRADADNRESENRRRVQRAAETRERESPQEREERLRNGRERVRKCRQLAKQRVSRSINDFDVRERIHAAEDDLRHIQDAVQITVRNVVSVRKEKIVYHAEGHPDRLPGTKQTTYKVGIEEGGKRTLTPIQSSTVPGAEKENGT